MIQPIIIYSKSIYSKELMERYSDAFVAYLKLILAITDPAATKVSEILNAYEDTRKPFDIFQKGKGFLPKMPDILPNIPDILPKVAEALPKMPEITPDTTVKDLIKKHPWLKDKAAEAFPEFADFLSNPFIRHMIMLTSIGLLARKVNIPFDTIVKRIVSLIHNHRKPE